MKDKLIASARGLLLIVLILGIPASLYLAYLVVCAFEILASHAICLGQLVVLGLGGLVVFLMPMILCIVGIKRLVLSKQNLNMGGALVLISALSLISLGVVLLGRPADRLTLTIKYRLGQRDFAGANLSQTNLSDTDLSGVNLSGADLRSANLRKVDLSGADLRDTNLRGADLTGATVTDAQLAEARSLEDAIMPDGSKHE
jgi:hypothetical protein